MAEVIVIGRWLRCVLGSGPTGASGADAGRTTLPLVRTLTLVTSFLSHPCACLCHSVEGQDTPGLLENSYPRKEGDWAGVPALPLITVAPPPTSDLPPPQFSYL